jgi:branched-chain amino acid transport system permease protein
MNYVLHLAILFQLYLMLALSLNLTVGYAGLLTLCHGAFYGIGAYAATLLMLNQGFGFLPALTLSIAATVILSLLVSWAALRFRGDYFVVASLAFQVIVYSVLYNWTSVTKGAFGISSIPKPVVAGVRIDSLEYFFVFSLIISVLIVGLLSFIYRSPFARSLQAIRDDEIAAISLGKNVVSFKVRSVAIAAGCAAVAGVLFATYVTYIDPTSFNTEVSILLLAMVIVGGTGNFWGPMLGVALLVAFPEILKTLAIPETVAANLRMVLYGLLLILVMRFRPQGLVGKYRFQ